MRDHKLTSHIIFDLDGTLVDSCPTCIDILGEMLLERGSDHVIEPEGARYYMSRGGSEMVKALLGPACGDPELEIAEFRARYAVRPTSADALFPGVTENLVALRDAGFSLAICSNKPQNLCEKVLADTGLAPLFTAVIGRQASMRPKPELDQVHAVLEHLGAAPRNCIFVGDSEIDYEVSRKAKIPFIFMTYGYAENGWQPGRCASYGCFTAMSATLLRRNGLSSAA